VQRFVRGIAIQSLGVVSSKRLVRSLEIIPDDYWGWEGNGQFDGCCVCVWSDGWGSVWRWEASPRDLSTFVRGVTVRISPRSPGRRRLRLHRFRPTGVSDTCEWVGFPRSRPPRLRDTAVMLEGDAVACAGSSWGICHRMTVICQRKSRMKYNE